MRPTAEFISPLQPVAAGRGQNARRWGRIARTIDGFFHEFERDAGQLKIELEARHSHIGTAKLEIMSPK